MAAHHAAPFIAAVTLSGVKGTERSRTPIASNTAFEIAGGTTDAEGPPAPHGRSSGRAIRSSTSSGIWGKRRMEKLAQARLVTAERADLSSSISERLSVGMTLPARWCRGA